MLATTIAVPACSVSISAAARPLVDPLGIVLTFMASCADAVCTVAARQLLAPDMDGDWPGSRPEAPTHCSKSV
jgi:hypothetical protein